MQTADKLTDGAEVRVRNIGGIDETTIKLPPGVSVLTGRNATNRTSFLKAIMGVVGGDGGSLKADADEGEVTLEIGGEIYTLTLARKDGTIVRSGDPYLDDPELADLFAHLFEGNEAREAIRRGEDLRDIIMRPVDTDAIQAEIDDLQTERRDLDERLDELDALKCDLPELEARRQDLTEQIKEKRSQLEEKRVEIDDANAAVEESKAKRAEFQRKLDELQDTRSELERVRFRIESQEESLDALRTELDDIEATSQSTVSEQETAEVDAEIDELRSRQQRLSGTISELQSIVQFNEEMLEGEDTGRLRTHLEADDVERDAVTGQLLESDDIVCWTCGTEVGRSAIESTVNRLRSLRSELLDERNEIQSRLDDLQMEQDRLEEQRKQQQELERRQRQLVSEIDDREEQLAALRNERADLRATVEQLEAAVDELDEQDYSEVISLHKEANQLEVELQRVEDDRDDVDDRIEEIESELADYEDIEAQRASIEDQLADLRTKVEQIEAEAVEQFNEQMESVLSLLGYENLDRIWIERLQREVKEGRRKTIKNVFELHVIRQTNSGTAYEDTVNHLSESEREVTGLVFALAGYLAHDVYETVPFILLDSLEAIDAERIASLVEHLGEYSDYLVVALLPEDASALPDEHKRITEI